MGAAEKFYFLLYGFALFSKGILDFLLGENPSEAIRRLGRERGEDFFLRTKRNIAPEKIATTEDLKTARFKGINH